MQRIFQVKPIKNFTSNNYTGSYKINVNRQRNNLLGSKNVSPAKKKEVILKDVIKL